MGYFYALGRRKSATARVRVQNGKGNIVVSVSHVELGVPHVGVGVPSAVDVVVRGDGGDDFAAHVHRSRPHPPVRDHAPAAQDQVRGAGSVGSRIGGGRHAVDRQSGLGLACWVV